MAPGAVTAGPGEACLHCQSACTANSQQASGVARPGIEIFAGAGNTVELRWACPVCCVTVQEECRPLDVMRVSEEIDQNRSCHKCRNNISP
jgi:hypothetical protein